MRPSISKSLSALFFTLILAAAPVAGGQQAASATVRGVVTDPQGQVIPGASVVVTSEATGAARALRTGSDGIYVATDLPPGSVRVVVTAPGLAERRFEDITLRVGQARTLDVQMTLPGVEASVTVHGSALTSLDTSGSAVDTVIGSSEIESLPLNGRNFMELALLAPGNAPAPNFDPTKTNTVVISSAGQLGRGGNVTLDGVDNNDDVVGGPLQNLPQDAVQEFQIATNRYSAEYGRSAGSVINVVTRSGGETLRGSASVFLRDDSWQALPATFNRSSPTPPFDRQQYAFALGGPIVARRAFWFGALEYRNQDGALLVGARDTATRTIDREVALAPLDDTIALLRADWTVSENDAIRARYAYEAADDVAASTLDRAIGSATQRQSSRNRFHNAMATWTRVVSPSSVNVATFGFSNFDNQIVPVTPSPQFTYPSLQDGASFRVPQATRQRRFQISDSFSTLVGSHALKVGGEWQKVDSALDLGVFQQGRLEFVQDFPFFDHNGDGVINDGDLLFAVTLRSGVPTRPLLLPDCNNQHFAFFVQDDWRVSPQFTLNLGLRWEVDTNVKNISGYDDINPLVTGFLQGDRGRDLNNWGPRIGFNWTLPDGHTSIRGGYGIYYDRVTIEIMTLERGLDGRALPIEVRAGNALYVNPATGRFPPFAPSIANPFTGFILPGAGASGINIIDNTLQNPTVQQMTLGFEHEFGGGFLVRADAVHNHGTQFIIGRPIGTVFNPVVGGPDTVLNLESSVGTHYDALLVGVERRLIGNFGFRAGYAWSKAFNYANDDQIPFSTGPIDPDNLQLEYGPTPNDQRHRLTVAATVFAPGRVQVSGIWTAASGVPMDILMPGAQSRIPVLQRNAGGRLFQRGSDLNAFIRDVNASGGIDGVRLPFVDDDARFNDGFNSLDLRVSRTFVVGGSLRLEPILEVFNLFNVTNILGISKTNYSGFSNVLVRDNDDPSSAGFLTSSRFGQPVTTAGGVFGSGGPRAFQVALRATF
jgi:Carboxypeptidase regulatory-like domain/TonB dependent receptor